ncbi:MAG: hypothetical protein NWE91_02810 [Candidatus Bathyarchaeota archaeon]|nr:hypothetical protein [Candidatus Bathyarchaeota archaeon]
MLESSKKKEKGVVVAVGDRVEGFDELLHKIKPKAVGFLIYTKKGFENATNLARSYFPQTRNCEYGTIHDTEKKLDFFSKMHRLINFIERDNFADLETISVRTENLEVLVQCAVCAHQARTRLTVLHEKSVFLLDFHEARLIDSLHSITRAFNLHQYAEVLEEISMVRKDFKTSKIKIYFKFLESLADAYASWDDRVFPDASTKLQQTIAQLGENADDFGKMGSEYQEQLTIQIAFIKKLCSEKPVLRYLFGTIDALCNGIRRYEKGDFLVGLLTIANSIEYSLRSRLLMKGYDIEKPSKLSKHLLKEHPEKAKEYLMSVRKFSIDQKSLQMNKGEIVATIKPTFTHKPGFIDMLGLLKFLEDELFAKLSPMIETSATDSFLSLKELNTLRNKVVHNMAAVEKNQVEEALKLARYVIDKFIDVVSVEYPSQMPTESREETKLQVLERQASHISLDYRELIKTLFGWV